MAITENEIVNTITIILDRLDNLENETKRNKEFMSVLRDRLLELNECVNEIGFGYMHIHNLWFQQYTKGNKHDWHTHAENYTGVYYLEYTVNAPPTELWDNSLKIPEVSEGDVVMFPAMTPHRAPMVKNDIRKTIVSFNFNVIELNTKRLKEFKKIVNST